MTSSISAQADRRKRTQCCIAGCGPAGALLGYLLARAGIDVVVLEKHADFLRDFRGDTIHPSTLEILDQLGLADRFLQLPHTQVSHLGLQLTPTLRRDIDLTRLPGRFPFVAFVPQWDFLNFLTREAQRYPTFHLQLESEATGLLFGGDGRVGGVRYSSAGGESEIRAPLTVGADGRTSVTRAAAGLQLEETSPPMDVLWFRISRSPDDPATMQLQASPGHFVALIDRREYWQVAWIIPKGAFESLQQAGLDAFRQTVREVVPSLGERVAELGDWEQVKLLSVRADRLERWYRDGYLAVGDAAHAMSPIGGVGINIAILDALVAANLLWRPLRRGAVTTRDLARVQYRRELHVRLIQRMQAAIQENVLKPTLAGDGAPTLPPLFRAVLSLPFLSGVPPRLVGYGLTRPRVRVPELLPATAGLA
ncbi:MAG: FAD-dependent oxidoreductase [Chloroflexi bacterium]|nr:FAD-dependent oxidoreductase [Chloroflexota bacterium]